MKKEKPCYIPDIVISEEEYRKLDSENRIKYDILFGPKGMHDGLLKMLKEQKEATKK